MCRNDNHGGRRCPGSLDKAKRSEQNRAYYLKHKGLQVQSRQGLSQASSKNGEGLLPSPSDLQSLFDRKRPIKNASNYYLWTKEGGGKITEWDETPAEMNAESQSYVDSIVKEFTKEFANGDSSYSLDVNSVTLEDEEKDIYSGTNPMRVRLEGWVMDENSKVVGYWNRNVFFPNDAPAFAEYADLDIYPKYQGKGLGRAAIKHFDGLMKQWGVENVEVFANLDVGGYAWAKSGYDWDTTVGKRAQGGTDNFDTERGWNEQQEVISKNLETYASQAGDPGGSIAEMVARLREPYSVETYPTPFEVANTGRTEGARQWAGKSVLMDSSWWGTRKL